MILFSHISTGRLLYSVFIGDLSESGKHSGILRNGKASNPQPNIV